MSEEFYRLKYLKYKTKYLELQMSGGNPTVNKTRFNTSLTRLIELLETEFKTRKLYIPITTVFSADAVFKLAERNRTALLYGITLDEALYVILNWPAKRNYVSSIEEGFRLHDFQKNKATINTTGINIELLNTLKEIKKGTPGSTTKVTEDFTKYYNK